MSTAQLSDSIEAAIAQTLERIAFGFSELRPKQNLAVRSFVKGVTSLQGWNHP